jgi:hypothetical protein
VNGRQKKTISVTEHSASWTEAFSNEQQSLLSSIKYQSVSCPCFCGTEKVFHYSISLAEIKALPIGAFTIYTFVEIPMADMQGDQMNL